MFKRVLCNTDINECTSNPCDSNAICNNTFGSFVCQCNVGFSGNGTSCSSKKYFLAWYNFVGLLFDFTDH